MERYVLLLIVVLIASSNALADTIYKCGPTFQNRPCREGESGGEYSLPPLRRYHAPEPQIQEEPRAMMNPQQIPDRQVGTKASDSVLRALQSDAKALRDRVQEGLFDPQVENDMIHLRALHATVCTQQSAIHDRDVQAICKQSQDDMAVAQEMIAEEEASRYQ